LRLPEPSLPTSEGQPDHRAAASELPLPGATPQRRRLGCTHARQEAAMNLLKIAHVPPICVSPDATVLDAIEASLPARVGAVAVVEGDSLVGIFTERDVMLKVVYKKLDASKTRIREVMTAPVISIAPTLPPREVLTLMLDKHIRHLPISEDGKTVAGMLSIRNILQFMVNDLTENLHHMQAFIGADSPGG
jgi:CBS domain-containing protein